MNPDLTSRDQTGADTRNQQSYLSYEELKRSIREDVDDQIRQSYEGRTSFGQYRAQKVELIKQFRERLIAEKEKFKYIFTSEKGSTYFVLGSGESFRIKKQQPNNFQDEYDMQPVTKRIFFIAPEDWQRLKTIIKEGRQYWKRFVGDPATPEEEEAYKKRKQIAEEITGKTMTDEDFRMIDSGREGIQRLVGEPIPTTSLKPGVIPLEIDIIGGGNDTIYSMDGNNLILMGYKHGDRNYPEGPGATHYGHPVTEIIKTEEESKF